MMSERVCEQFERDGYAIIEDFLTKEEVDMLRSSCHRIVDEMNPADHAKVAFRTDEDQCRDRKSYFIESGDKVRYFFEEKALDDKGDIVVEKEKSLNKIGHALHWLVPEFKKVTFSKKVQNVARNLGYKDPRVFQSMYIFKQPRIGGAVPPHQDATFIYNDPLKLFGLWIALEDCTTDNACLYFVPGSHKTNPVSSWMRRTEDGLGTYITSPFHQTQIKEDEFIAAEVKAGSMVLIDSQVIHKSEPNTSEKSRHIYTFHVMDAHQSEWDKRCWLQPTDALPFPSLYREL